MRTEISRDLPAITAGMGLAMYPMMTTPLVVGGIVEHANVDNSVAGWVATVAIGTVAITAMGIPLLLQKHPGRACPLAFAVAVTCGFAGYAAALTLPLLLTCAVISGFGSGGLLAAMAMRIAKMPDPDRIYGTVYAITSIGFAIVLLLLPELGASTSPKMEFVALGAIAAALTPMLLLLRPDTARGEELHASAALHAGKVGGSIIVVVLSMTVAMPLYGGVYAFSERRAVELHFSAGQIGLTLSLATVMSILGALAVAWIGTRPGRTLPTMAIMAIATLSYGMVLGANAGWVYVAGMLAFGFMQLALNSYFFGLASALDPKGQIAAALQGYSLVPYALGAGLFGSLAGPGGLQSLTWPSVFASIVGALILLPLLLRMDKRAKALSR